MSFLINTYKRLPVCFERGEGVWLWDKAGKKYLDALGGIAVSLLGHGHPEIVRTITEQAQKVLHTSNLYTIEKQEALGEKLCRLSKMDGAFFCNSGAEANETAFKLSKIYGHKVRNIINPHVIVMENAFHGRTFTMISATGNPKVQEGFEPLVPNFIRVPFDDPEAVARCAALYPEVVAVLVEPIQGEGGIRVPQPGYLRKLREICDQNKWLLMLDEVQCGLGRTGKLFAYEAENVLPDVVTLAKGLANGIPIGACLIRKPYAELLQPGSHGTTFGGNPFSCSVALKTLEIIEQQKLWENAGLQGAYLIQALHAKLQKLREQGHVKAIRGQGLMLGIELDKPCRDTLMLGLAEGILFSVTRDNVIRFLPPLIIEHHHCDQIAENISTVIQNFYNI
ncbi:MAG: aspartate aminotransferase family protein [Gammaproteobacteria bacterium]